MMKDNMLYVVCGASGNTGRRVSEVLPDRGRKVRVIGRTIERLRSLVDRGAETFGEKCSRFLQESWRAAGRAPRRAPAGGPGADGPLRWEGREPMQVRAPSKEEGMHHRWLQPAIPARPALLLLLAAVVPAMAACGSISNSEIVDDVAHCQGLRWPVKTGTDQDVGKASLTPEATTINALVSLPIPHSFPEDHRIAPTELTTFQLTNVTMTHFERSLDGDFSMTLSDGQNHMEAEIPDPDCVGSSSPFAGQIAAARQVFEQRFPTGASQDTNIPVTVVGVGFFDVPHPTGAAPNFIELHPVLNLCFEQDCTLP